MRIKIVILEFTGLIQFVSQIAIKICFFFFLVFLVVTRKTE